MLNFLIKIIQKNNAVIPRWPNGYIEPLHAVYKTEAAKSAAKKVLNEGKKEFKSMINRMNKVFYNSTIVLEKINPQLTTFLNINTVTDLNHYQMKIKIEKPKKR